MSIIKSVLIYGCGEGTLGSSIAMALAGKAVHVFACWPSILEMSHLEDIPNVTTSSLDPNSPLAFQTTKEVVTTRLNRGQLNIVINAGFIGHEDVRGCTGDKRGKLWGLHISTMKHLAQAFGPLLTDSHGTIINLTSHEMLVHELAMRSLTNAPEGMARHAARLSNDLQPLGVKLINIGHEGEHPGRDMVSSGARSWSDVAVLAKDIINDVFRLPGTARVL